MDFPRAMREVLNGRVLKHTTQDEGMEKEQFQIFYKLDEETGDLLQSFNDPVANGWERTEFMKPDLEATDYEIVEIDEDD